MTATLPAAAGSTAEDEPRRGRAAACRGRFSERRRPRLLLPGQVLERQRIQPAALGMRRQGLQTAALSQLGRCRGRSGVRLAPRLHDNRHAGTVVSASIRSHRRGLARAAKIARLRRQTAARLAPHKTKGLALPPSPCPDAIPGRRDWTRTNDPHHVKPLSMIFYGKTWSAMKSTFLL